MDNNDMASILVPSKLLPHLLSFSSLRHYLLLLLHALVFLLRLLLSVAISLTKPFHTSPDLPPPSHDEPNDDGTVSIARALSDVLAAMARVPVWSRKYELVRDLADRLVDDNLRYGGNRLGEVNRVALSAAFARTVSRVEVAAEQGRKGGDVWSVWSRVRRWKDEVVLEEGERQKEEFDVAAEKMAAELLWLAEKMVECGAAAEAVGLWGKAEGVARIAVGAEPRLQSAFVKVSAFLFKHVEKVGMKGEDPEQLLEAARCRMSMLTSWLPLLCRAANGTDAPVLGSSERAEIVKVLEQIIEKLSREQQEEVLTLWLHHFTACPHSDWPNLQSCYIKWYNKSRKVVLD